jgi:hypothetical protein
MVAHKIGVGFINRFFLSWELSWVLMRACFLMLVTVCTPEGCLFSIMCKGIMAGGLADPLFKNQELRLSLAAAAICLIVQQHGF